jgi:hypothetical protein
MKLVEVVTQDGEVWVEESYADRHRRYTHTFVADDSLQPSPLYPGYSRVPDYSSLPGVPIFTRFTEVGHWSLYQPETYKLDGVYRYRSAESRGTLGLGTASAYHVAQVGTFYVKNDDLMFYETPNTPCVVKRRDGVQIGVSLASNEPARFLGDNTFLVESDVSVFGNKLNPDTDVLAFINGKPETVHAHVYGLVSGSFFDHVIVAPLLPSFNASSLLVLTNEHYSELEDVIAPASFPEPPETAMFTGSSSGTVDVKFEKYIAYLKYALSFGEKKYYLAFKHGWVYRGFSKPGDSGGPLFRIVPPRRIGLP